MNRREFIKGSTWIGAATLAGGCMTQRSAAKDGELCVFLSDLHVEGANPELAYAKKWLEKTVGEILRISPAPRCVICFGDISCSYGLREDYVETKRILAPLEKAGIPVHFVLGNHDRRSTFFAEWPECKLRSPVAGRCVSVVDLGPADIVLLDALRGTDDRPLDDAGPVGGTLDDEQLKWFENFVANAKRPYFVGSHQFTDLFLEGDSALTRAARSPWFSGWIYGHNHQWQSSFKSHDGKVRSVKHTLGLPSSGLWGDIGYVLFRCAPDVAEAQIVAQNFFYPRPLPAARRPKYWDVRTSDINGMRVHFPYGSV